MSMNASWIKKSFGSRLRFLRSIAGLTQANMAEMINVTEEYVSKVERGLASPSFDVIGRFCGALDTEPANLFLFTAEPDPSRPLPNQPNGRATVNLTRTVTQYGSWEQDLLSGSCDWSPGLCRLLGIAPDSDPRHPGEYLSFIHPDDQDLFLTIADSVIKGHLSFGFEYRIVRPDGMVRHVIDHCDWQYTPQGEPARVRGVVVDITEQKRLEHMLVSTHQRLEERIAAQTHSLTEAVAQLENEIAERKRVELARIQSEERYRSLFENSPISLWEEDLSTLFAYFEELREQGVSDFTAFFDAHPETLSHCASLVKVLDVNQATLDLLKATSKEQLLTNIEHILTPKAYAVFRQEMILLAEGGDQYSGEISHRTLEGEEIDLLVYFKVLTPERVIVSLMDITQRTQAEKALAESEMKYRLLTENAEDVIWVMENDGSYSYISPAIEKVGGFSQEEALSRTLEESMTPESYARVREAMIQRVENEARGIHDTVTRLELEQYHKDGSTRWMDILANPILDEHGKRIALHGLSRDITERKKAQEALLLSESRLKAAQKVAGLGSFDLNLVTGEVHLSEEQCRLLGLEPGEAPTTITDINNTFVHPDDRQRKLGILNAVMAGNEPEDTEFRVLLKDGSVRHFAFNAEVINDTDGRPLRLLGVTRDVTEQRRHEAMREDVQRIIRHDLRIPLAAGATTAQLLCMDPNLTEEQTLLLRMLGKQHRMALERINRMMVLFRVEDGSYISCQEPTDVIALVGILTEELERTTLDKELTLSFLLNGHPPEPGESHMVNVEQSLCHTLLSNLLHNAVEASPAGCTVEIRIDTNDGCRVDVSNQGVVPEEVRDRFFEKFVTANKETGTGLGTYAVKLIVETLGGEVSFSTDETTGTTVSVRIPGIAN
ncbi:MAG: PAS domain S-box protein [Proteobacteria bacterium]|nr:PAS domain S-box protein [Pseudomonadota bacterium]